MALRTRRWSLPAPGILVLRHLARGCMELGWFMLGSRPPEQDEDATPGPAWPAAADWAA